MYEYGKCMIQTELLDPVLATSNYGRILCHERISEFGRFCAYSRHPGFLGPSEWCILCATDWQIILICILIVLTQNPSVTSYAPFITVEIIRKRLLNIPSLWWCSNFLSLNSQKWTVNGVHVNGTVTVSFLLRGVMQFANNDIIVSHQPFLLPAYPLPTFYCRGF